MISINTQGISENNEFGKTPIKDVSHFYTGEVIEYQGKMYHVLDAKKIINQFGDDKNAIWGKKTAVTLIRKAISGEVIFTYVKNEKGEKVLESETIAKEGQYVFQNINDSDDIYIPQNEEIIYEYEPQNNKNELGDEFKPFIRKSKPSKLLHEIIKKPTLIIVESWGNFQQFLEEGATLKLENNKNILEVTGINKGGFEAWSFTDADGNIYKNSENKIELIKNKVKNF